MKFLTKKERKNPFLIIEIVMETIKEYGNAQLDCGHIITNKNIKLVEMEDGQFVAICDKCKEGNYGNFNLERI